MRSEVAYMFITFQILFNCIKIVLLKDLKGKVLMRKVFLIGLLMLLLLALISVPVLATTINERPIVVRPGEDITISYPAVDEGNAWIGFYKVGAANTAYISYSYLRNLSGEYTIKAPKELGIYHFRIFGDGGYDRHIGTSSNIQVVQYNPIFQLPNNQYLPGETMIVNYSDAPVFDNAWIGLYKVGADDRQYISYKYLRGNTSGNYSVAAPSEAGQYEFRIFLDSGYTFVGRSQPITVGELQVGDLQPSISLSSYQARPGQKVTATYHNASTLSGAWIGFYQKDSADRSYISYVYTRGKTTGSYEITAPNTPGQYNFRLFKDGGYTLIGTSGTLTVGDAPSPTVPTRTFTDLASNHWAHDDIMDMVERGILSGYPDGTFRPNNTISRAEFAKIMVLALELGVTVAER